MSVGGPASGGTDAPGSDAGPAAGPPERIPRPRAPSTATAIGQRVIAKDRANRVTMIIATAGTAVGMGAATASR